MGHDIKNLCEPDLNSVAKRLASSSAPCSAELVGLMDCMKKYATGDPDTACTKERSVLAACMGRRARPDTTGGSQKRQVVKQLQGLVKSWKRYGF